MSLDGAGKVVDPRSETVRFKVLQHQGFLRPAAGPWVNTIEQTAPLSKLLQRRPNVFNPLPSLKSTKKVVAATRRGGAAIRRKGAKFIRGKGIKHPALPKMRTSSRKPVVGSKRHVSEV